LSDDERQAVTQVVHQFASAGYRVLAVGQTDNGTKLPETQSGFVFTFKGLLAFLDPPRDNMSEVLSQFYQASIRAKIITGDNAQTRTIASQIGFQGLNRFITGDELMNLSAAAH